ncbi:Abi-domain-containing protein [Fistulina hepatica ATCC 64428]|uniref:intramembrane prenyl-peptidase Rce1 n=1 Tax=Fistulina hepatica ATCC 64428 TaxID=1128425 RepID=A0A0D7AL70_9AGAR|nr:Abi-domain-containing protein [Fistulina hepatica ATCC 64428]
MTSLASAHAVAFGFSLTYVGSLYLSKHARLSFSRHATADLQGGQRQRREDERWRDDPDVIKARLVAVISATVVCCAVVGWLYGWGTATSMLGLSFSSWRPHLLAPLLYLGPIYAQSLIHYERSKLHALKRGANASPYLKGVAMQWTRDTFATWIGWRNYIIAPITEEVVFRACVLSVYRAVSDGWTTMSPVRVVWVSPLFFGVAHVHHAWEVYNTHGRTAAAAKRAVLTSLFQLAYTSLFGAYCACLFLRAGSVLPPITAHIWCNSMGIPQLTWELSVFKSSPVRRATILLAYVVGIALTWITYEALSVAKYEDRYVVERYPF